jgi:hypothetical protein
MPGMNVVTMWSKSMVRVIAQKEQTWLRAPEEEALFGEPIPRRVRPWPVLRLPKGARGWRDVGVIDEGCEFDHALVKEGCKRYVPTDAEDIPLVVHSSFEGAANESTRFNIRSCLI